MSVVNNRFPRIAQVSIAVLVALGAASPAWAGEKDRPKWESWMREAVWSAWFDDQDVGDDPRWPGKRLCRNAKPNQDGYWDIGHGPQMTGEGFFEALAELEKRGITFTNAEKKYIWNYGPDGLMPEDFRCNRGRRGDRLGIGKSKESWLARIRELGFPTTTGTGAGSAKPAAGGTLPGGSKPGGPPVPIAPGTPVKPPPVPTVPPGTTKPAPKPGPSIGGMKPPLTGPGVKPPPTTTTPPGTPPAPPAPPKPKPKR